MPALLLYSLLHFLIDGICALAMYSRYIAGETAVRNLLFYNFCAFALQMPLGAWLDLKMAEKRSHAPAVFAVTGIILTLLGSITHPILLGLGNAFFHVGGGVDSIYRDRTEKWQGRGLGIFVAPGALGLFIGGILGGKFSGDISLVRITVFIIVVAAGLCILKMSTPLEDRTDRPAVAFDIHLEETTAIVLCTVVVILRSYNGLMIDFPWKTGMLPAFFAVIMVVLGKMAGGFAAAVLGMKKAAVISLAAAAVCYAFGAWPVFGLAALLFFNMTMPMTLYLLTERFPGMGGSMFGLLTIGLFLGYLPKWGGYICDIPGTFLGCLISVVSGVLLVLAVTLLEKRVKNGDI